MEAEGTNLILSVLNSQFHCHPQGLPVTGCLDNVTNIFWRQTQEADLGGQDRGGTNLATGIPQGNNFDLLEVKPG